MIVYLKQYVLREGCGTIAFVSKLKKRKKLQVICCPEKSKILPKAEKPFEDHL